MYPPVQLTILHSQKPTREYIQMLYAKSNFTSEPIKNQEVLENTHKPLKKTYGITSNTIKSG